MPIINENFPKTKLAREEKLNAIKKGDSISTVKVPGHGKLEVYRIPLEYLTYNPYNTRFLAQAKTLEKRLGRPLNNEKPEDIEKIERFLWKYKEQTNKNTIESLINDGQLQPGIVTIDGVILSGNRRFRLLNEIDRNKEKYRKKGNIESLTYFEAAILDQELDKKQIVRYESFYQYGTDDKVDYDPIQKYIAAYEQKELGFDNQEIAENFMSLTAGKKKEVEKWLSVFELMDEYLDYIDEAGIYTALTGQEESFLNLYSTVESLNKTNGKARREGWDYDENDIVALKQRYFDYIRNGMSTHQFRNFKKIFLDKKRWFNFNQQVTDLVAEVDSDIKSVDEYREVRPADNEDVISKVRNADYRNAAGKQLQKIYGQERAYIESVEEEETPIRIAQQAIQKLEKLEKYLDGIDIDTIDDIDQLVDSVRKAQNLAGKIKQRID